ncbi:MAG: metal ABC transporter permease [Candidatus Phytoplasma stylosanthis]|uniref:metal ABC transporter permease n=1 Tax=Candidatus Phytoplasma stylosanthis TaxID=2798314 RepID=UPI00293AA33C|nr:metal ABC transporter permease [Candidatus Phytoplasma stylosanthis]MDV3168096.1 metal ABC transporter permease [Candidatus Phytoplasma stylosanthis]MDV3170705.1 metal ABC transporter permease [Candidatus Phytoplasma stylosanthis]MDV3173904.1 metal ABC transporter permease [Candidatus Phytoplasma stylosanthis]MDV3173962.1 metal ABC transporter permease [Candidatus Phytoplasma stylosanthis]MDV3202664.1 metal ABC transporter permease [Candidatus Phytoplasma stylosanthis]
MICSELDSIFELLKTYTTLKIFIGSFLLGISSGILGIFIILKKKALVGDALSHTVLPGIAIFYIIFQSTNELIIWFGALSSSILSLILMEIIKKYSKIRSDTILSLILASFFGLGNILIAYAQKGTEDCSIAVLEKFILGQIALISKENIISIGILTFLTIFTVALLWKEFKVFAFDEFFAKSIGLNNVLINLILNTLLIGLIVISLKITGIILTSAFLIMPGVAARQISDKLSTNIIIASVMVFLSSFIGIIINLIIKDVPTGPIIIVINTIFIILTCLFSPKYGIIKKLLKQKKYRNKIKKFKQLIHFYYHNKYDNDEESKIENFLFKENYLYRKKNKIIITTKGIHLVENLINGKI